MLLLIFLVILLIWEIIIPLLTGGQNFFKQKLNLVVRGSIKILIPNPYGLIFFKVKKLLIHYLMKPLKT
ncbi:Conserved hypothetical protein (plasmid) [Clostridium acetobutylicum EA 2018]|uniref:Uncharacterized protein n=1 Tax=Clostridium acetobutylicum (strain ATCC 824 / DSM 792 / JCM 1419 / IAM 19013 / LMG 5710 / NBRC 13948 / NRRL B-527 / VKM B-1787 / 2291 / W) TaxID=272562 RepID=Q97TT8_CLOAB|nr:Hypothetical protein CA_P0008 [Clostridium acetobutylicum ATCC 824]ADZ22791.1 Conserved hypothetical protein [Clostridium acetobutylicum EA 2018]AEI34751.1 hypothetical protein SMB_P008 [Clostridium acetobutylicum DSM 1731]AWV82298.1 hypothetical protein DK921_19590 [Clostridium acetobutylicum]PSM04335.1 hypothetical protein C7T89_18185 [Clostridium sp. NJ4]